MDLWDDQEWFELASWRTELARATGALSLLPYSLDYLAENRILAGDLSMAASLLTEAEELSSGSRADTLPYIALLLAVWRGQARTASRLVELMTRGAGARGEGCALAFAEYATATLHNGLGQYELASDAAQKASAANEIVTSSWALYELVEAASRSGRRGVAGDAVDRLSERLSASGTEWAKGTEARSRALVEDGERDEDSTGRRSGCSADAGWRRTWLALG